MKDAFDSGIKKLQKSTETVGLGTTTEAKNAARQPYYGLIIRNLTDEELNMEEVFEPSA
jgi:hypothetical protein